MSTIAFIATNGVEEVELARPWGALRQAGYDTHLLSLSMDPIQAVQGDLTPTSTFQPDRLITDVEPSDYAGLVLPGGVANPDALRAEEAVIRFIQETAWADRPVAAICHAPWLLIEAGLVQGRKLTAYHTLRTDIINASGHWQDEPVIVDGSVITSQSPDTLDEFIQAILHALAGPGHRDVPVLAAEASRRA